MSHGQANGEESAAGGKATSGAAAQAVTSGDRPARRHWFVLRKPLGSFASVALGVVGVAICLATWWYVTRGERSEDRLIGSAALPSPAETYAALHDLWVDSALARNTLVTLRRVAVGFALAAVIGIPIGVLAGCFPPLGALFAPLLIFGRNIPIAALIPLTFFLFGIGESQKVLFIFLACVAFIISDTANAIRNVSQSYVDTAYTLGANRWQVIVKTLVPLAMPKVFDSLRLLFGLAFGYIMLAETIQFGSEEGGIGNLILKAQRRNRPANIYIIILIIPVVALLIDRVLYWIQRQLFPYRYGGSGWLLSAVQALIGGWESFKGVFFRVRPPFDQWVAEWEQNPPRQSKQLPSDIEWRP